MMEQFEMVVEMVMVELGQEWYEVVDGDGWELVEARCSAMLGCDCWDDEAFAEWAHEVFADL